MAGISGNVFSNMGLASQGIDSATAEQQKLTEGAIGLTELQRQVGAAKSNRAALSNVDPATGQYGALTALATQQKENGDPNYMQTQDQIDKLMLQGRSDMAQAAVYGLPADQAEQQHVQKFGTDSIVPGSLEFGTNPENGHHLVSAIDPKTNQRKTWDASQFMSMQQAPVTLHPDEKVVRPLTGETISENPTLESGRYGVVQKSGADRHVVTAGPMDKAEVKYPGENGGSTQYLYNSETGKWIAPPGSGGGGGGGSNNSPSSKDLPTLKAIGDEIEKNEKMGQINPETGKVSVTGAGSSAKVLAGELYYGSGKKID